MAQATVGCNVLAHLVSAECISKLSEHSEASHAAVMAAGVTAGIENAQTASKAHY